MFKCLRLFDPAFVADAHPGCEDIEELRLLPFFNSTSTIDDLKHELPTYIANAEDVSSQIDKTDWWKRKADELPKWANACKEKHSYCNHHRLQLRESFPFCQIHFPIGKSSH